ncbi:MAG: DUF4153 domain-containing protein [Pseudomonadota bacterium]
MSRSVKLLDLGRMGSQAAGAVKTFPLPFLAACLATIALVLDVHDVAFYADLVNPEQLVALLILGFMASLIGTLIAKGKEWSDSLGVLISLPFWTLSAYLVFGNEALRLSRWDQATGALFLGAGMVALATVAPVLVGKRGSSAFWDVNRAAWTGAAFATLVTLVFGAGLSAVLWALQALFGLEVDYHIFTDIWVVAWLLVWPWRFLASLPAVAIEPDKDYCPKWIAFLARFMLVPLASLYLVILYAFAVKILVQWQLPEGQVAWLVCIFAAVGVATKLVIFPLRDGPYSLLRLFDRFFGWTLLVPVGLLAAASWVRIESYGITELRYLLILATFWMLAVSLFFALGSKRLMIVPFLLGALLTAASVGPWGVAQVSLASQLGQLQRLLEANGILVDGRLQTAQSTVSLDDRKRISSIISFLTQRSQQEALAPWVENGTLNLKLALQPGPYEIVEALGFDYVDERDSGEYISFYGGLPVEIDLADFDFAFKIGALDGQKDASPSMVALRARGYDLEVANGLGTLTISNADDDRIVFNLSDRIDDLRGSGSDLQTVFFDGQSGALVARLYVDHLNGKVEDKSLKINHGSFYLLIGQKG